MEVFSGTGQLVTPGLVDSSIGAMAKGLALVDVEASIAKELLCSNLLIGHLISVTGTNSQSSKFSTFSPRMTLRATPSALISSCQGRPRDSLEYS